jgi:hypothetical protein
MPALPISIPHTRSRYSGSSVTSSTPCLPSLDSQRQAALALHDGTARGTEGKRKKLTRVLKAQ